MSEFRFLHAADIHLDSPLRGLERYEGAPVDDIREAARRALENLVELALEQQVNFVLIAGDLYDGDWKDHNTGLYFVKQLAKLHAGGIGVYVISGNHDAESKMTKSLVWPKNPDGTKVMLSSRKPETVRLPDLDVAIHGRGFGKAKETSNLVLNYPAAVSGCFNIGMLHTALTGADGHESYAPCSTDDLNSLDYQYWALGHVHNREHKHDAGATPIVFPGNIQGRHIRETGPKGCELVTVDSAGNISLQFCPLDVFRWEECSVDVSDVESADDVLADVRNKLQKLSDDAEGRPLAVRIRLTGATAAHNELAGEQDHWTQQIRACAMDIRTTEIWVEKVCFETRLLKEFTADDYESGPVAELLQCFEELEDDEGLLLELFHELEPLRRKLTDELVRGEEAVLPSDAEQLKVMLKDVQPLLIHRLQQEITE